MRAFVVVLTLFLGACGGGEATPPDGGVEVDAGKTIADFLPALPEPTGAPRAVHAGPITDPRELIPGPASSGLVGDFFMRNSRARFVIQAAERSIGIVPYGGNVIDAVALDEEGADASGDELGELGMIYLAGRTCQHTRVEVLRDGSGGGPAVIRASGRSAVNDYVNLRAVGLVLVPPEVDPDLNEDGVSCATRTRSTPTRMSSRSPGRSSTPVRSSCAAPSGR